MSTTILPDSEALKKAVRWISEILKDNAGSNINALLQEASLKFNLTPKDSQFLENFYFNKNQNTIH
jgi:hypothetical protein